MVTKQKLLYQLDTPNPSKGFRFVAFLVLEILGGPFRPQPPFVLGVGTKTFGARRVKDLSKNILKHWVGKGKSCSYGDGVLKVSPSLPPPPRKF